MMEFLTVAAAVISALTSLATLFVAAYGLHTWKLQHLAQINFELARKLLRAANRFEDAVRNVRITLTLFTDLTERAKCESEERTQRRRAIAEKMLEESRNEFRRAYDSLRNELEESEMVWDHMSIAMPMLYIYSVENELSLGISRIKLEYGAEDHEEAIQQADQALRRLVSKFDGEEDPFGEEVKKMLREIKRATTPHLRLEILDVHKLAKLWVKLAREIGLEGYRAKD